MRDLKPEEIDRIIEMAWEDRTPFEAIAVQFGLDEADVIRLMRREMHIRNWKKWRARVQGRSTKHVAPGKSSLTWNTTVGQGRGTKHLARRDESVNRFKCDRQRRISNNHISKRKSR